MAIINPTLSHVNTQRVGVAFTVHGTFQFADPAWVAALEYSDGVSTAKPANLKTTVGTNVFSFVHPGYVTPGKYTLTVAVPGGMSTNSNEFEVVANVTAKVDD